MMERTTTFCNLHHFKANKLYSSSSAKTIYSTAIESVYCTANLFTELQYLLTVLQGLFTVLQKQFNVLQEQFTAITVYCTITCKFLCTELQKQFTVL